MQWYVNQSILNCFLRKYYWIWNHSCSPAVFCLILQVHHGFYSAYYNTTLRHEISKSVQWAWKTYGKLPINVVGHSMGGALASFCALDLSVSTIEQSASLCVTVLGHAGFCCCGLLCKHMQDFVVVGCYVSTCRISFQFNSNHVINSWKPILM
jgi:hypothetical protein